MNIKNLLLATTAILLAACSTDSDVLPPQDLGQIRVTASVGAMTRVAHSGNSTTFETNDRISVYAWLGADNNMQRLVVDNSINTLGGDGTWTADPQMLWADNTSDHYFLGIYPERNGATDYDADPYTLDFNNQTASDLLVARTTAKPTGSAVKLEFEHVMAKLVVNLSFRNEWTTAPEVASVTATACTEATVNYLENPVEVTPATGQNLVVIPFTGTSASFAGIMIPGQSGFRTINVTLENGKVYTYTHSADIDLQPGRYTTVNLVLGRDRIELDDAGINVSDWENGTSIDGDVVNSGDTDINIILDNDIDLSDIDWTPIGDYYNRYTGTFDGGNYTITGLTVNQTRENVGLIGCIGSNGTVKNVKLENVNITGDGYFVGGVAGTNYGTIENCSVDGTLTNNRHYLGGVVGNNYGSIIGCSSSGTITGTSPNVGGIGGQSVGGTIMACYSVANIKGRSSSGGVLGQTNRETVVIACYHAKGNVTGEQSRMIGGVIGWNYGKVTACYWENNQGQGIGDNQGSTTIETTKVDGTGVTWQKAVAAMNTALQSAGSGWHYVLNGALPTLEEK